MRKSWGLTQKILLGDKKVESRWYKFRVAPWDRIKIDDTIYFKDSGESVTVRAKVLKVLQFSDLNSTKVWNILQKYYKIDGIDKKDIHRYYEMFKNKNYCILIFLKDVCRIKPFEICKKGFGTMAAWICIDDIKKITIKK